MLETQARFLYVPFIVRHDVRLEGLPAYSEPLTTPRRDLGVDKALQLGRKTIQQYVLGAADLTPLSVWLPEELEGGDPTVDWRLHGFVELS